MSQNYLFSVKLIGFDEERKRELRDYILRNLHPRKGLAYFKQLLEAAREGQGEVIYETNNPSDARRIAYGLVTHGGQPEMIGDFEVDDDLI